MLEQECPDGIGAGAARGEVVLHEKTSVRQQIDRTLRVLRSTGVEEEEVVRRPLRQMVTPVPDEELDVVEPSQPPGGDLCTLRVPLDRHERPGRCSDGCGALAEGRAGFGAVLAG